MTIAERMLAIAAALPQKTKYVSGYPRDVCLTLDSDRTWTVLAGGHPSVHIGEWGGDYSGHGNTPEEALAVVEAALNL